MKTLITLSLILLVASSFQIANLKDVNWPFKSCGDGNFKVDKVTLGANPTPGKVVTLTVTGSAKTDIQFTQVNIALSINGLPINVVVYDWAKSFGKGAAVTFTYQLNLPTAAGSYSNSIAFYNPKDETLACIQIAYKF